MSKKSSERSVGAQISILIGVVLIFFGIIKLLEYFFGSTWWGVVENAWNTFLAFAWPAVLIGLGIYLVWIAKKGKFKGFSIDSSRPLRRSALDRRILGVCGGIAEYLNIDPTIVRVLAIILLVVSPLFTLIIYLLAGILMPKN